MCESMPGWIIVLALASGMFWSAYGRYAPPQISTVTVLNLVSFASVLYSGRALSLEAVASQS